MKKFKLLFSALVAGSLMASTSSYLLADDLPIAEGSEVIESVETSGVTEAEEIVYEIKSYLDLSFSEKSYAQGSVSLGAYPFVDDMDELNEEIEDFVWEVHNHLPMQEIIAYSNSRNTIQYTVENDGRYAIITINVDLSAFPSQYSGIDNTAVYYVDKETNVQITEEQYNVGKQAQQLENSETPITEDLEAETPDEEVTEVEESQPAEEVETPDTADAILVSLRLALEGFDYDLVWDDATRTVEVLKGNFNSLLTVDSNIALVNDEEVILSTEAIIEEDLIWVPIDYLQDVLGLEVIVGEDNVVEVRYQDEVFIDEDVVADTEESAI
jgi:hypothetical protein